MKKFILFILLIFLFIPVTAHAATKVEKPTYKVTVSDKGVATVTFNRISGVNIQYRKSDKSTWIDLPPNKSLTYSYNGDTTSIVVRATKEKNVSEEVKISFTSLFDKKYKSMLKSIVDNAIKGKTTDENKLRALWDWISFNINDLSTLDNVTKYSDTKAAIFSGKVSIEGYANLWKDMAELAGFETVLRSAPNAWRVEHVDFWCYTKVKGKWYYVQPLGGKVEKGNYYYGFYMGFLSECVPNPELDYIDISLDAYTNRYELVYDKNHKYNYFDYMYTDFLYWNDKKYYDKKSVIYNKERDQYVFNWKTYIPDNTKKTTVAKPTYNVTNIEGDVAKKDCKVTIEFLYKNTTKGTIIYYTTDGTTPYNLKGKFVTPGTAVTMSAEELSKLKVRTWDVNTNTYSAVVTPNIKLDKVAKPTYKTSISDDGNITITFGKVASGVIIQYSENVSKPVWKTLKADQSLVYTYKDAPTNILIRTVNGKSLSNEVNISISNVISDKFWSVVSPVIDKAVKNNDADEEKLRALWDWIMFNTEEASVSYWAGQDYKYSQAEDLIFVGKGTDRAFADFWYRIANKAGFETILYTYDLNHQWCYTKVNEKWFVIDAHHYSKETDYVEGFYDGFLTPTLWAEKGNEIDLKVSSDRYLLKDAKGKTYNYFNYMYTGKPAQKQEVVYNKTKDRYVFK